MLPRTLTSALPALLLIGLSSLVPLGFCNILSMFVRLLHVLFDMRLDRLVRCYQLVCTCSVWEEFHFPLASC